MIDKIVLQTYEDIESDQSIKIIQRNKGNIIHEALQLYSDTMCIDVAKDESSQTSGKICWSTHQQISLIFNIA